MNINATLFVEMLVFISFVGLTRRYIWPPIIQIIDQRQADIIKGVEDAKTAAKKLEMAENDSEAIIAKARKEYKRLIDQAEHTVTEMIEDATAEAKSLEEQHILAAQERIHQQITREQQSLKTHTLSFVENVLHKVIVKLPDQPQLNSMINHAIGEVSAKD